MSFAVRSEVAEDRIASDPPITMDKVLVNAARDLPQAETWSYAKIPGFEVLSNAGEAKTIKFLKDFDQFRMALSVVWPMKPRFTAPVMLVLCGRDHKFDEFKPQAARKLQEGVCLSRYLAKEEQTALVLDMETGQVLVSGESLGKDSADSVLLDLDSYKLFYRQYVQYLFLRNGGSTPAWLVEGVSQIVMRMEFGRDYIVFGDLKKLAAASSLSAVEEAGDPAPEETVEDVDFNIALRKRKLLPWDQFFKVKSGDLEQYDSLGNTLWSKQAYAFVHMCLYGRGGRYQKPFAELVRRLETESVSEDLFRSIFHMDYHALSVEMRGYIEVTDYTHLEFRAKGGAKFPQPQDLVLSDATASQVGRIKGEAFRLAGMQGASRQEMLLATKRERPDPDLCASLGLSLLDSDKVAARELLERAMKGGSSRATAYLELARLRRDSFADKRVDGRLTPAQTLAVLQPLFDGRTHSPVLTAIYHMIGKTWLESAAVPSAENLNVIVEGLRFFPKDETLKASLLELQARPGIHAGPQASQK